jgi:hypothetical protein
MPERYHCPRLAADVELNDERRDHIMARHADGWEVLQRLPLVIGDPDVAWSERQGRSLLFAKTFDFGSRRRHIVVIVVRDDPGGRYWVTTAYGARRLGNTRGRWEPL